MDQPNVWRLRKSSIASGAAVLLAVCGTAFAQETPAPSGGGSFFSRDLGTALRIDYNSEYYGTDKGVVAIGGMKVFNGEGSTWFLDAQGTLSDDFGGGYNAGIGYRVLRDTQLPYDSQRIHGVSFWSDGQSTSADNFFSQLGVSLESMGDKWDARLSGYFPLSRSKTGDPVVGSLDDPFYEGFRLLSTTELVPVDTALTVVDGEVAHRLMDLEAWAFLGGYHLGGGGFDDGGYRVGVRGYAVPDLQVTLQVSDDDIYGTNVSAGITWFVGRTTRANQPLGNIMDRFREPVLRNDFIATTQRFTSTGTGALTDNTSGEELAFIHVDTNDGSAVGDGSFENPYLSLDQALGAGSSEDDIILVHGGSGGAGLLTGTFTFQNGQRLLGEGLDADMTPVVHTVNTTELGLLDLPETAAGASSLARPMISGIAGDVFVMADDNELNNFDVDGGARAIVASMQTGIVASNLALMNQTDAAAAAIDLDQVTGTNIIDNSVIVTGAAGRGIRVVDSSGVLGANATVEDTGNLAVEISGWGGGAATFGQIGTETTANTGGVVVENNTGGTITFSSLANIDTIGTPGVNAARIENNTGATITFEDLRATDLDDDTVFIRGGGIVNLNNSGGMSTIESTGTGDAVRVEGVGAGAAEDPSVTVASDITNTAAGRAVSVDGLESGTGATFSGAITDTSTNGSGILVQNNTTGTIAFTGTTTLDTGNNTAVDLINNDGATINFSDLIATAANADTVSVVGGGNVNINDVNDTSVVTNTGNGRAVFIDGDSATAIAADIAANGTGLAVQVEDRTANDVTFTGTVGDGGTEDGGVLIQNVTGGTVGFSEVLTVNESNRTGVQITGTNTGGTFTFNGLDITTTGQSGFSATGGGTLAASNAVNPNTVNVTGAAGTTGVEINGMTIDAAGVSFDTVNVTGGDNGVVLTDNDAGAIVIGSDTTTPGNISNTTMNAIAVDGGTSVVTVNTTANVAAGRVLDIQNRTGGTTTIAGDLTTTGGTGVSIANNTGGSIALSGDLTLETGANDAVTIAGNDGAAVSLTGTTIDLQGTTGNGINVSGTNTAVTINADVQGGAATAGSASVRVGGDTVTTINGNITNTAGATVLAIDGLSDGQVNATGDLTRTGDGSTGVELVNNTGGTAILSGDITLSTETGTGIEVSGNSTAFSGNITGSASNNFEVTTTSGTGLLVSGGGNIDIVGNSTNANTINTTTGTGVRVEDAEDLSLNFTDINVSDSGTDAVDIVNTAGNTDASRVRFDQVNISGGRVGVNIMTAGSGELDVTLDDTTISGVADDGIRFATGANTNRVDFVITGSTVTAADNNALQATLGTNGADVRFQFQGNTFINDSTAATVDIQVTSASSLNALIGNTQVVDDMDPVSDPIAPIGFTGLSNSFTNDANDAVDVENAFNLELNNAGGLVNLDLRNNRATSDDFGYVLTETAGDFNLVDATDTINGVNNVGTVDDNGVIDDINPPVAPVTP